MENIEEIKKGKRLSNGITIVPNLYLYNGKLYKLFKNESDLNLRTDILDSLYDKTIHDCARISSVLYDDKLEGYGMEYYKDYKELAKLKRIPTELKKIYIQKMIEVYKELIKRGFVFWDFHGHNVLVKSDEIRLIDVDSCLKLSKESDILGTRYLNELVLKLLFDSDFFDYQVYYGKEKTKQVTDLFYSDLSYESSEKGSLEELDEYAQSITESEIRNKKKQIDKLLKR